VIPKRNYNEKNFFCQEKIPKSRNSAFGRQKDDKDSPEGHILREYRIRSGYKRFPESYAQNLGPESRILVIKEPFKGYGWR
jgi:hypothetical protein